MNLDLYKLLSNEYQQKNCVMQSPQVKSTNLLNQTKHFLINTLLQNNSRLSRTLKIIMFVSPEELLNTLLRIRLSQRSMRGMKTIEDSLSQKMGGKMLLVIWLVEIRI